MLKTVLVPPWGIKRIPCRIFLAPRSLFTDEPVELIAADLMIPSRPYT